MFGSTILDVAIGIVFIFLLASLIASAIREGIESWTKTRASELERGLREILRDPEGNALVQHFYDHPYISSLYPGSYTAPSARPRNWLLRGDNLPSYIPSRNFALALMDMAARGPGVASGQSTAPVTLDAIRQNLGTIDNAFVQRALLVALDRANDDLQAAQLNLEAWYNSAMDRVSGWYKRRTQWFLFIIGLFMAVALNIDTLKIANTLYHDKTSRDLLVDSATKFADANKDKPLLGYTEAIEKLNALNLPVGWMPDRCLPPAGATAPTQPENTPKSQCTGRFIPADYSNIPTSIPGWLLTALAVTMGAPFWFDWLNKLIVIRSTVKPHQKSPEEPSQDSAAEQPETGVPAGAPPPSPPTGGVAPAPPAPPPPTAADGCDVDMNADGITPDEDLPVAVGGVSK